MNRIHKIPEESDETQNERIKNSDITELKWTVVTGPLLVMIAALLLIEVTGPVLCGTVEPCYLSC